VYEVAAPSSASQCTRVEDVNEPRMAQRREEADVVVHAGGVVLVDIDGRP